MKSGRTGTINAAYIQRKTALQAAFWGTCLVCTLVIGEDSGWAQSPARPPVVPSAAAVPAPPPSPQQLAASLAGLRKEVRRQTGELRAAKARQAQAQKAADELVGKVAAEERRMNTLESLLSSLLALVILLCILAVVLLTAAITSARRLTELEAASAAEPTAPSSAVQKGIRAIEERLQHLEAEEEFPQRGVGSPTDEVNGEGAPALQRE